MKKNKLWLFVALFAAVVLILAACGENNNNNNNNDNDTPPVVDNNNNANNDTPDPGNGVVDSNLPAGVYVDDNGNYRFTNTRNISVALWERPNERMPVMAESYWAEWVAEQMLATHNVQVEWVTVPRWGPEHEHMSMLIGAGDAPDVSFSINHAMVQTFQGMGALQDLAPLLDTYRDLLPNMFNLVGEELIYWDQNPITGELFNITGRLFQDGSNLMFIREDWLAALDLPIPSNFDEFEYTLRAFRDRASELPGYETMNFVVPYMLGSDDITWHGGILFQSLVPSDISDRDWFVYGQPGNANERLFHHREVMREGTRIWNRWFNEGLLYDGIAVSDNDAQNDLIANGWVGAFSGNWDFPYRASPGFIPSIRENTGVEDANFIPILPFLNDAGNPQIFMPNPTDRRIFFPQGNNEQLASLLYLDFMSRPEVLDFLQFGYEGVHHEVLPNGAIATFPQDYPNPWPNNQLFTVIRNFDIALMVNGVHFWDTNHSAAEQTVALGYPGIPADLIIQARNLGLNNGRWFPPVPAPPLVAVEEHNSGLISQRIDLLVRLVAGTSVEDFDAAFDREYDAYLRMGGQAIIDERAQVWEQLFGN